MTKIILIGGNMTKGTDNRNIKMIVRGILQSNGIDNLKLEIDLVSAWQRYVNEREDGMSPAETRAKIAEEYGALGFMGVSDKALERARMMQLIMDTIGLDVDENNSDWAAVISHCLEAEKRNETVSAYRDWMNRDPYNSPKKHQIAQSPILIKKTWRSAFETAVEQDRRHAL